jgi:hypothetical protein
LAKSPESDIDAPITSGGAEELLAEPGEEAVAELEHAPSNSAAATHPSTDQRDRPTVLTIRLR